MRLMESVRRLAVPAAGLLGAVAMCVACSSSTSGSPNSSSAGAGVSLPGSPSISIPFPSLTGVPSISGGIPSLSGIPSIGGDQAGSAFCKDFDASSLADLGSTSDASKALAQWDKLAADAPAEIKDDVQAVDDYLHDVMAGKVNPSDAGKLSSAASNLGKYYAAHCLSS